MPVFLYKQILPYINVIKTAICKREKNRIKRKIHRNIFNLGTTYIVSSSQKLQQGCMTMILNLDALQLYVSHFGRKYLQNNEVYEMAGLRTNASFMALMVQKR